MGTFCSGVYGARYRVLVWGRMYVRGRAVELRSSGEPDQAPCHIRRKKSRLQGRQQRADYGGHRVDGRTIEEEH